jgi:hypothetical protein
MTSAGRNHFFLSILALLALGAFFSNLHHESRLDTPKLSLRTPFFDVYEKQVIEMPTDYPPMDAFPVTLTKNGRTDFIVTGLNPKKASPLRYLKNLGEGTFIDASKDVFTVPVYAEHARHILVADVDGDGAQDVLVADHGFDRAPFLGGQSKLLMATSDGRLRDESQRIPQKRMFTYHLAVADLNGDGAPDLYLSNMLISRRNIPPALLLNDGHGFFQEHPEWLPEALRRWPTCYMSATFAILEKDASPDLILGACDRPNQKMGLAHDRVLRKQQNIGLSLMAENIFPPREKNSTWGTAEIVPADFNQDGKMDFLVLPHNFGFSESALQLYINVSKDEVLKFRSVKLPLSIEKGLDFFIAWAEVGDVNGDGLPDILFSLKSSHSLGKMKNTIRLLLNQGQEKFVDASDLIPVQPIYAPGARFLKSESNSLLDIFILDEKGKTYFLKNKGNWNSVKL